LTTLYFEKNPIDDDSIAVIAAALKNNQVRHDVEFAIKSLESIEYLYRH